MAALFNWPPTVSVNGNASSYGYWYSDYVGTYLPVWDNYAHNYAGAMMDQWTGPMSSTNKWQCNIPHTGGLGSGPVIVAVNGSTYTTTNGYVMAGGYSNSGYDIIQRYFPDFSNELALWCTNQDTGYVSRGFVRSRAGLFSGGYATAETIPSGGPFAIGMGTTSVYYYFWNKQVQTGSSMGSPVYKWFTYYTKFTAGAFTTSVNINSVQNTVNELGMALLDAGEGYYYLLYTVNDLYLAIRGVNLSGGGTPVVTGLLGSSGVAGWECTYLPGQANQRYITLGTNRVCVVQTPNHTITITFTSGTKATPTIVKTARASAHQYFSVEYDPAGTGTAYIVGWTITGPYPTVATAAYAPVATPATAFSADVAVATIYPSAGSPNVLRDGVGVGCAQQADTYNSIVIAGVSETFGYAYTHTASLGFWHTPVNFNLGVEAVSTYTSASVVREVQRSRTIDIASTTTAVTVGMAMGGAHSDDFTWSISNSNYVVVGCNISSTYSSVSADAVEVTLIETTPLVQHWTQVGYTYMDDFMVYVNQDRAAVGLPPYKTFGADGQWLLRRDIANLHASNMAWYRIYAHQDSGLPPLQQTPLERSDGMPSTSAAENIQLAPIYYLPTNYSFGYTTAHDAWLAWHNSPPHYGNIIRNWGTDNDKAYSLLGVAEQWYPTTAGLEAYYDYTCLYLCNNFVILETLMFEISLQQFWDNSGALISKLEQLWSNEAWDHVSARHETSWSMRVSNQNSELLWGCRTAAQNTIPLTYSSAVYFEAPYGVSEPVSQIWHEGSWSIKATETVVREVEVGFALRVASWRTLPYALLLPVQQWNDAGYRIKDTEGVVAQLEAPFGVSVTKSHTAAYAITSPVEAWNEAGYRVKDTETVVAQLEAPFVLSVTKQHTASYSVATPVETWNEAGYRIRDTEPVMAQVETGFSINVSRQHTAGYSVMLPVVRSEETGYAIRDTEPTKAQNDLGWALQVTRVHEAPFSIQTPVEAFNSFGYRIMDTEPIAVQLDVGWSNRVTKSMSADYAISHPVSRWVESGYRVMDTEFVSAQNEAPFGIAVEKWHRSDWTNNAVVQRWHTAGYGDVVPVRSQEQMDYALLVSNPVSVEMSHYYAMRDYISTIVDNSVVRIVLPSGVGIIVDDAVIDSAEGDIGYSFECAISDINVFTAIKEDDPIVVDFCGELYNFIVSSKSLTRNSGSDVAFRVTATNAVVRLGAPYAQGTDYIQDGDKAASQLIDDLVEIDFTYELVDWLIPAGRLQAAGATSLEAVKQIAEATGGVVDADPAGDMVLRYPYPYATNALEGAVVGQTYSDDYDNLSVTVNTEYRDNANRFRIREGEANFADTIEWVADQVQSDPLYETGIVKAYLSPYRNSATIRHLGNAVYVEMLGEETELNVEVIEFNEGVGNTKRPIHTLVSVEWITADMGAPAFAPFSTLLNVNTSVNSGYGLAKVTYNAKHLTAKASGLPGTQDANGIGPASSYAYFILEESNGN